MSLVEEPLAGKPFFTRVLAMTKMIGSFVLFVGPAFMIRHRPGVMVPLAEKVGLISFSLHRCTDTVSLASSALSSVLSEASLALEWLDTALEVL
jgi:hypothetical protein